MLTVTAPSTFSVPPLSVRLGSVIDAILTVVVPLDVTIEPAELSTDPASNTIVAVPLVS